MTCLEPKQPLMILKWTILPPSQIKCIFFLWLKTHVENELKKLADSVGTCLKLNKSADEEMKFIEIVAKYGSNVHGVVLGKDIITQENTLKKLIGNQTNVETVFLDEFMLQEESKVFQEIRGVIDEIKRLQKLRDDYRTAMAEKGEQSEMSFLNESRKGSFERVNEMSVIVDEENPQPKFTSGSSDTIKVGTYDISIQDEAADGGATCENEEEDGGDNVNEEDDEEEKGDVLNDDDEEEEDGDDEEVKEIDIDENQDDESSGAANKEKLHATSSHIGSIIFEDGDMVFIDKNNNEVKLMISKFEVTDYMVLEDKLVDIAFIGNGEFAFALSDAVAIFYIHENETKIRLRSTHKMRKAIKTLCMMDDSILITSEDNTDGTTKLHVQEMNRQFELLREIENFKDGEHVLQNLKGSCVGSRNSDDIVVGTRDYVRIFDRNGQQKLVVHERLYEESNKCVI